MVAKLGLSLTRVFSWEHFLSPVHSCDCTFFPAELFHFDHYILCSKLTFDLNVTAKHDCQLTDVLCATHTPCVRWSGHTGLSIKKLIMENFILK